MKKQTKDSVTFRIPSFKILKNFNSTKLLSVALLISVFSIGYLLAKVQGYEKGSFVAEDTNTASADTLAPQAPPQNTGPVEVSIDDDPVMGDENALLTLIEFGDFECPFCKQSFEELLPQIKKDYIDTGKVKFVYRDLPLDFHQNAHKQAQAAECARDQGGDETYFKYHDEIYTRTTSNGTGLANDQLPVIAQDLGLNVIDFQSCLDSEKYKEEVDKDVADASAAGANGTPSWFIGKTTEDGVIQGELVVGAQPYDAFKTIIDQKLSE